MARQSSSSAFPSVIPRHALQSLCVTAAPGSMSQLKDLPAGPLHRPPLEGFMICLLEEKTDLLEQAGLQHKSQVLEQLYFQLCLCACVRVMGKLTENTIKGRHGFCVRDNSIRQSGKSNPASSCQASFLFPAWETNALCSSTSTGTSVIASPAKLLQVACVLDSFLWMVSCIGLMSLHSTVTHFCGYDRH